MKSKNGIEDIEKFESELSKNDMYRMNRRTFVKIAGVTAGAIGLGLGGFSKLVQEAGASVQVNQTPLDPKTIPKYMTALPSFAQLGRADGTRGLTTSFESYTQQILPASMGLPRTVVWAYKIVEAKTGKVWGPNYPAFTIVAKRNTATSVTYANNLAASAIPGDKTGTLYKLLTVDQTLHWADPLGTSHNNNCETPPATGVCTQPYDGAVPAVVHLHGGEAASISDGGPDAWFTPGNAYVGPAWTAGVTNNYSYPNGQEATTLWYHDHTLGATRLNVYAGLAGF